jgi:hypothetical protein
VIHQYIKRVNLRGVLTTLLIAGSAGCAGIALTDTAPPVNPAMTGSSIDTKSLSSGRQRYLTRCARCHVAQPVRKYSREQWELLLPGMSGLSKLNTNQTAELRAYVLYAIQLEGGGGEH